MIYLVAVFLSLSVPAHADDEINCATDNTCIQDKVEAGEKEFKRQQRRERRKERREKKYVPCAADYDCQRTGQDAADREHGIKGQED